MKRRKRIFILLVPALVLYLGLFIFPAVQALYVSLNEWSGFTADMKFVGFKITDAGS